MTTPHFGGVEQRPTIIWCDQALGIIEAGSICVVIWHGEVTPERFRRQELALQDTVRRHPGYAGFICVVDLGVPPPDERMRAASAEMINSHGQRLRHVACVIEGSGFRAAVTRSALSAIARLTSRRELKFTATLSAGAAWMARQSGDVEANDLLEVCASLRAQMARMRTSLPTH